MPSPAPSRADPFGRDVIALFGLPFDKGGLEEVARRIAGAAAREERLWLSTVNLDWLAMCRREAGFHAAALASDLVTMDGVPVVALARLAGAEDAVKVAGSDLFEALRDQGLSTFFFGGREGAAERASAVLAEDGRAMRPAGFHNPGFGDVAAMSAPEHLAPVNASGADLLVAALGARKGQAWLLANEPRLIPPVIAHLGAVVDFVAGTVIRAPRRMQLSGLEWLWRVRQDPALWRRYAEDARLLPALIAEARAVGRLTAALRRSAGPAVVTTSEAAGRVVLTITGAVTAAELRAPLRAAVAEGRPITIRLEEGAAPDLGALGQLLIARCEARAGHEACFGEARVRRLYQLTVASPDAGL